MAGKLTKHTTYQPGIADLITFDNASKLSGFTTRHLRNLADTKQIWAVKLGRNWFTTTKAVNDYLATERKPGPKSKKPNK
jgi:hypothetical protein